MCRIWGVGVGVCRIEGGRLPKLRIRGLRLNAFDAGVNHLGIFTNIYMDGLFGRGTCEAVLGGS